MVQHLKTFLLAAGAISEDDYDRLWGMMKKGDSETQRANSEFLIVLPSRGRTAYLWLCHLLQDEQKVLFSLLGRLSMQTPLLTIEGFLNSFSAGKLS